MASILVVDDERSMREFLEILLRKEGHDVAVESDAAAALARAAQGDLDLVITDLRLGARLRHRRAARGEGAVALRPRW